MITLRQYEFSAKLTVTKLSSIYLCFDHNLVIMFIIASRHCSLFMDTYFQVAVLTTLTMHLTPTDR